MYVHVYYAKIVSFSSHKEFANYNFTFLTVSVKCLVQIQCIKNKIRSKLIFDRIMYNEVAYEVI